MASPARIEQALDHALQRGAAAGCPPRLAAAVRHAVFPGGARIRPQLVMAVARACGDDEPALTDAAAVAVELIHCASLVHDDLPCFDDAPVRRGQPSVHCAYGERLAVLAGDALIVMAFDELARAGIARPGRLAPLIRTLATGVGMPQGIVAGQAWECEPRVPLREYQRLKTGALFAAATRMGALAAGGDAEAWSGLGAALGEAYQVADDIRDVIANPEILGKPIGQDVALGRPSVATEQGLPSAMALFERLVLAAIASVPECRGAPLLRALVRAEAERLVPPALVALVAAQPASAALPGAPLRAVA